MSRIGRIPRWLRWGPAIVITIAVLAVGLLYSVDHGIPFVEGDWVTRSGAAYGFKIGSSRPEAFRVIREHYTKPGYELRVVWERASALQAQLAEYENPESKEWTHDEYSHWRQPVAAVVTLGPPLQLADRWDVEMPANWVNDIYLTFVDDRLVEIQRSHWVFERP